jgi:hypothetical protein
MQQENTYFEGEIHLSAETFLAPLLLMALVLYVYSPRHFVDTLSGAIKG